MFNSAITDDIDYYHRNHEMMAILSSKANRDNMDCEGLGRRYDDDVYQPAYQYFQGNNATYLGIAPGTNRTVSFKPIFGIINQPKYLTLCFGNGMVFELDRNKWR